MTDRVKGCYVAFTNDMRIDDVESILTAIRMIRGVEAVELNVADHNDFIHRSRVASQVREELFKVIDNMDKGTNNP